MADSSDKYRAQIVEAWNELQAFERLREVADERIADLRDLIKANANFLSNEERIAELLVLEAYKRPTNIAEAVKLALVLAKARKTRLTPVQIREEAEKRGFNFDSYTNPMASIHTILRRMKEADPPEVDYAEESDTYSALKVPTGLPNPELHERITKKVFARLLVLEGEKAKEFAKEEFDEFFEGIYEKRGKRRD